MQRPAIGGHKASYAVLFDSWIGQLEKPAFAGFSIPALHADQSYNLEVDRAMLMQYYFIRSIWKDLIRFMIEINRVFTSDWKSEWLIGSNSSSLPTVSAAKQNRMINS